MRIENGIITLTDPNEVFVFGSNKDGFHDAGAARYAHQHYGAIYGQGHGLQGKSYAIDTMSGIVEMHSAVSKFLEDARKLPEFRFIVTPIGCGIAGYCPHEVGPMFHGAPANVILPQEFMNCVNEAA